MIEYITNEQNQTIIYQTDGISYANVSSLSYIKSLCMNYLFTYEGYLKAVKRVFDFKYRIPLYIHNELQMIATKCVKDYENIWINYAHVISITYLGNRMILGFTSHRKLEIKMTRYAFSQQIKRLTKIKFHISKHFHYADYRK